MKDTLEKITSNISISLVLSVLLIGSLGTATAGTIYVDANATLGGDGTTWGTAYKYLQDALYKPPVSGDDIWVATGTYKPDQDEGSNVTVGDRDACFELKSGVAMYGGFPTGGSVWEDRDPNFYETILSGDLNGDDGPDFVNYAENSKIINRISWRDGLTTLDGFTIEASYDIALYNFPDGGGQMLIANCKFLEHNRYAIVLRHPDHIVPQNGYNVGTLTGYEIINCIFQNNGNDPIAAVVYIDGISPIFQNCIFKHNNNRALYCKSFQMWPENLAYSNPTFINSEFFGNAAGILIAGECISTFVNCVFAANNNPGISQAGMSGGGLTTLINCTITNNTAGIDSGRSSEPPIVMYNSIVWGNGSGSAYDQINYGATMYSSTIQDDNEDGTYVYSGAVNPNITTYDCIDWNPNFVRDPYDGGDGWGVGGNDDYGDLHLSYTSPCIDAGDNTAVPQDTEDIDGDLNTTEPMPWDLDGNPRFYDDAGTVDTGIGTPPIVDMGAYEGANTDGDGIPDHMDNCPDIYNPDQSDGDEDQIGDICDNCPNSYDPNQVDTDIDGVGDVCDNCPDDINPNQEDDDGDLVGNVCDNCPDDPNPDQEDTDVDSIGNVCDNCPDAGNADQTDSDGDGIGDECECSAANLDGLNPVNFEDFAILAHGWEDIYGLTQLAQLAQHWLESCP